MRQCRVALGDTHTHTRARETGPFGDLLRIVNFGGAKSTDVNQFNSRCSKINSIQEARARSLQIRSFECFSAAIASLAFRVRARRYCLFMLRNC